jgi:hypothetical protein
VLDEIRTADPERLQLRAVHTTLDPLVHCLACNRRVDEPAGLLDAVVIASGGITGPHFGARATHPEARKRIAEVHECQLYHSLSQYAIAFRMILAQVAAICGPRSSQELSDCLAVARRTIGFTTHSASLDAVLHVEPMP